MEYRKLGASGFSVPALCLGTGTFGGASEFFKAWGETDVAEATRLVDICLEAGLNMFDSADGYSAGRAEEILGQAIKGRRDQVIISTKATFRRGKGPNDVGSSRYHLTRSVEASLRRLGTDVIDLFQLHAFDAATPIEETLHTLDDLVTAGKIRYIGCSNFSGWHLMKSLAISQRHGWARHVAHQAYYSLVGRDYEWELMPLALDQGVGCVVWSPLGWGRLTGKVRRGQPLPQVSRLRSKAAVDGGPQVPEEQLYRVVDALDAISRETGKTVPQIALNWLLRRPTVSTVIIGARNEQQLRDNLGAVGWTLTPAQVAALDAASAVPLPYPYWHQAGFQERNPGPVLRGPVVTIRAAKGVEDVRRCFPVMAQLRPHLQRDEFVERVMRQGALYGYSLAFVEDEGRVVAVAGYRISESLHAGRYLYVDDLVTDEAGRSRGYGEALFDWLVARARDEGCAAVNLESGVQRHGAHRFYMKHRMHIASYHFVLPLDRPAERSP